MMYGSLFFATVARSQVYLSEEIFSCGTVGDAYELKTEGLVALDTSEDTLMKVEFVLRHLSYLYNCVNAIYRLNFSLFFSLITLRY